MKSGVGTASMDIGGGVILGALVAVNAFGDVINPQTGEILAGLRSGKVGPLRIGSEGLFCRYAQDDERAQLGAAFSVWLHVRTRSSGLLRPMQN